MTPAEREELQALLDALAEETIAPDQVRRLEELVKAPIALISTGPDREETIVLRHPFG